LRIQAIPEFREKLAKEREIGGKKEGGKEEKKGGRAELAEICGRTPPCRWIWTTAVEDVGGSGPEKRRGRKSITASSIGYRGLPAGALWQHRTPRAEEEKGKEKKKEGNRCAWPLVLPTPSRLS